MADPRLGRRGSTPSSVPQKRSLEDEHAPAVSSPLNPDSGTMSRAKPKDKALQREQRDKKDSLKKRESKAGVDVRGTTPDASAAKRKHKSAGTATQPPLLAPLRYKLPPPKPTDFEPPRGPVFTADLTRTHPDGHEVQFYESSEHVYNRKGFRYTHCIADPAFPSSLYYRQTDTEPFGPRIAFEDTSSYIQFDQSGRSITTEKGYRMGRANVGVREGSWYWECKIISGVAKDQESTMNGQDGRGHVRMGWARREASLDAPVGFDAYSYGFRDVGGQKLHMSRPKDCFPPGEDIQEGDVIGLEINLPSLALHRKVVGGYYNPAVDFSTDTDDHSIEAPDVIRDRVPIRYKAHLYFEQFEYHATKDLEELMNPSPVAPSAHSAHSEPPNPNHPSVALRTLPGSYIKVYKNGKYIGTPLTDLLAFLPPASKPQAQPGARDGLDDGMLGYFPAVSVFRGGAAEVNFGPDFWCPPWNASNDEAGIIKQEEGPQQPSLPIPKRPQAMAERYNDQIAEDVVYDLVDEVDFWVQDGGSTETKLGVSDSAPTVLGPVDPRAPGVEELADGAGANQAGEIKEIVQEDE
ncbi:hypothetical protein L228DRAFT_284312 [Xylona heveae TC161]|uniref:B30.2/SPRY domain-containing protein n=1 Tax=Xylona heveae (strain CBS 132557 / TC161) TaxID=1328760 RepID=A0A165FQI2_XYLHT|nr:hypothetical protein L228DRAFT_284312 [Xylona heveae TC161]KZF21257.1 hypothetical protein L228DRAFT_284312 [Xylona heveae TC161]